MQMCFEEDIRLKERSFFNLQIRLNYRYIALFFCHFYAYQSYNFSVIRARVTLKTKAHKT